MSATLTEVSTAEPQGLAELTLQVIAAAEKTARDTREQRGPQLTHCQKQKHLAAVWLAADLRALEQLGCRVDISDVQTALTFSVTYASRVVLQGALRLNDSLDYDIRLPSLFLRLSAPFTAERQTFDLTYEFDFPHRPALVWISRECGHALYHLKDQST